MYRWRACRAAGLFVRILEPPFIIIIFFYVFTPYQSTKISAVYLRPTCATFPPPRSKCVFEVRRVEGKIVVRTRRACPHSSFHCVFIRFEAKAFVTAPAAALTVPLTVPVVVVVIDVFGAFIVVLSHPPTPCLCFPVCESPLCDADLNLVGGGLEAPGKAQLGRVGERELRRLLMLLLLLLLLLLLMLVLLLLFLWWLFL